MFKDFLGRELYVGDWVVTVPNHYKEFRKAQIMKFTPKMVRVAVSNLKGEPTNDMFLTNSEFLIKIEGIEDEVVS